MQPVEPEALPVLTIDLEFGDSPHPLCHRTPTDFHAKFTDQSQGTFPGFGFLEVNASVLVIPDDIERDWWSAADSYLMRQKVRKAVKQGYEFAPFDYNDFRHDVYEINTSKEERQGRQMSETYRRDPPQKSPFQNQTCVRHRNDYFGAFKDGKLYGYILARQCGEMVLFSEIIGHGDHLDNGIMQFLLFETVKVRQRESRARYGVYHLHHNGTNGLQFFKRKMGFAGYRVHWQLSAPGASFVKLPEPSSKPVQRPLVKRLRRVAGRGLRALGLRK